MNIALLFKLREAGGEFVPLPTLGPEREAVFRDLEELTAFGFAIERHPYLGAAYREHAHRLCPDQIEYQLGTRRVGRRIAVWKQVTSTNDLATRASASIVNEGLVVLAEEQTAGRGRRGRTWTAPAQSSILMSILLFPTGPLADPTWLTALAAVVVAEVVSKWTGRAAAIKWPNDVRVQGRKLAGILVEHGTGAVIGIGLNANLTMDAIPAELRDQATSLQILLGHAVDRSDLVRDLLRGIDDYYDRSARDGAAVLHKPWRERSEHFGRIVDVSTPSATVRGRVVDLDLKNGLQLAVDESRILLISSQQILSITSVVE